MSLQTTEARKATYLKDYRKPDFVIKKVELQFELAEDCTLVTAKLHIKKTATNNNASLVLDGKKLQLLWLKLEDKQLTQDAYNLTDTTLIIKDVPEEFTLESLCKIFPHNNTALVGLYKSRGIFCTQCEATSFSFITYYLDRPDVMAKFTTTIIADKTKYPVLLSNGNKISETKLANNKHSVTWEDPFDKPCYLFALVAGDLDFIEAVHRTKSGRDIKLLAYANKGKAQKCEYALKSLQDRRAHV